MKREFSIAFETVIWGRRILDFRRIANEIASLGYQGIEIAQHPQLLGVETLQELQAILRSANLTLLAFAGGPLKERMSFCGEYRPPYLYIDSLDEDAKRALSSERPFVL